MALDVPVPDPPDVTNRGVPYDLADDEYVASGNELRREEIELFLEEGAWREAFSEWASYTDLREAEWAVVIEADLVHEFDFYWDPSSARLGYTAPRIPSDWRDSGAYPDSLDESLRSKLNDELDELADAVVEMLEDYVTWGSAAESDRIWSEETASEERGDESLGGDLPE